MIASMIGPISHQIFWTIISFALFFLLMRFFVIRNVVEIQKMRSGYIEDLSAQISTMNQKTDKLKSVTYKILHEEIPTKQRFYVEKKLEPVLAELHIIELNEKDLLQEKLAKHKIKHFKREILANEQLKQQVYQAAQKLVDQVCHEQTGHGQNPRGQKVGKK